MTARGRWFIAAVFTIGLVYIIGRSTVVFYTDFLWFTAAGYADVFQTRVLTAAAIRTVAGIVAGAIIYINLHFVLRRLGPVRLRRRYGNLEIAEQVPAMYTTGAALLISIFGGWSLAMMSFGPGVPLKVWAALHSTSWGVTDPLFHRDLSFYVFTLPALLTAIDHILVALFWSLLLVAVGYSLVGGLSMVRNKLEIDPFARTHIAAVVAIMLCTLALRIVAGRYGLVVGGTGVQEAVGYTDVHARLFGQWALAWLAVMAAALIVYGARRSLIVPPIFGIAAFVVGGFVFEYAYPSIIQRLKVQPNELARETPYIAWNLEFTRRAYGIDSITHVPIKYETATPATWSNAAPTLSGLALWDVDQLEDAFDQVQSMQGYYEFKDVDFDRYALDNNAQLQQVGIGVREFKQAGLPEASRSWFNLHLNPDFTRGVAGAVALTDTAVGGAPRYLVGELAPIRVAPEATDALKLTDPSVYYGENSEDYIVLGGDGGAAMPAALRSGVSIGSFLRVLSFAWRFGDHNLLFTGNIGAQSRILYHRLVRDRVMQVAPFLEWDRDALPVIVDGRMQWVLDGYTTSASFPMSTRAPEVPGFGKLPINYIRGSVKATIDAVTGETKLYATAGSDPILRSYAAIFPGLIRDATEMPAWLQQHMRYPAMLLAMQSAMLGQYHVEQPNAFYAGQDAWQVPVQGAAAGTPRPNEPLYLLMQLGANANTDFVSMLPFNARERQNLTAMLIAQNDHAHYGKLTLLQMTGDEQIKGPAQIQSLIEQDPEISQQLSLWRQLGTAVELGQLRIIPAGNSVLYIEPLFLAAEVKAIPQLHRVLVSDGANVAMAETLDRAITALYAKSGAVAVPNAGTANGAGAGRAGNAQANVAAAAALSAGTKGWPAEALQLYQQAETHLRNGDFAAFGASWTKLRAVLQKAAAEQPQPPQKQ